VAVLEATITGLGALGLRAERSHGDGHGQTLTLMDSNKRPKHTTGGIPRWSPTLVLVARFSAYVWQSGRDAQFSLTYGRMYQITVVVALQKENADFFSPHKSRIFRDSRSTIAPPARMLVCKPRGLASFSRPTCVNVRIAGREDHLCRTLQDRSAFRYSKAGAFRASCWDRNTVLDDFLVHLKITHPSAFVISITVIFQQPSVGDRRPA
jgi:hypothetical protein